ncbi:MAG: hypothetical protein J0L67_03435 [Cytophagales bacterium]|nr:hypothetical protein [Cytophagales bacterium]
MKYLILFAFAGLAACAPKQSLDPTAESKIREVLTQQQTAWNEGNLEKFMEGYWKSDSLQFIGSSIAMAGNQHLIITKRIIPRAN